jgi:hypothetical protein
MRPCAPRFVSTPNSRPARARARPPSRRPAASRGPVRDRKLTPLRLPLPRRTWPRATRIRATNRARWRARIETRALREGVVGQLLDRGRTTPASTRPTAAKVIPDGPRQLVTRRHPARLHPASPRSTPKDRRAPTQRRDHTLTASPRTLTPRPATSRDHVIAPRPTPSRSPPAGPPQLQRQRPCPCPCSGAARSRSRAPRCGWC